MFLMIISIASLLTLLTPIMVKILRKNFRIKLYAANPLLPMTAAVLFFISFYLPEIHVSSETTTFQQHLIGGGFFSALLYIYFKQLLGIKNLNWFLDFIILFSWVSALGVANKLGEFFLFKSGVMQLDASDAYWDLLANTVGAFLLYCCIYLANFGKKSFNTKNVSS